jgi:hypothetical protein
MSGFRVPIGGAPRSQSRCGPPGDLPLSWERVTSKTRSCINASARRRDVWRGIKAYTMPCADDMDCPTVSGGEQMCVCVCVCVCVYGCWAASSGYESTVISHAPELVA